MREVSDTFPTEMEQYDMFIEIMKNIKARMFGTKKQVADATT